MDKDSISKTISVRVEKLAQRISEAESRLQENRLAAQLAQARLEEMRDAFMTLQQLQVAIEDRE